MTLATIIETLKMIALKHPNVNSAYEGNIYEILNSNPNNKYASVVITQQSHTTDEVYDHYGFVIFYVDRLVDDMEENRVQIQSCGKSMLGNIITFFCEEFEAECDNITYQPFTQKFVDMTCGVYCTITIDTVKDVYCPEEYWKEDWVTPVTVIRNQDKRVTFTENGTYTIDYDPTTYTGLGNVEVDVNIDVDSYYNNGYNQGKTDGVNEQKSKLESINITENGTYTKEDGYSEVVVNVPDLNGDYNEGYEQGHTEGYNQGKTDGVNEQKGKLSQITISENGTYTNEDGYSHIEVNVPDLNGSYDEGYAQGKTDGINEQKSKLERINITVNGTYTKEDGYNQIEVNVPDLNGSYDEGYDQGQADVAANARVLNVTENGVYRTKFSDSVVPTVTGVYANGTDFYNYAELGNKVFNTKIVATQDSRLEFWYKGDKTFRDSYDVIIGAGNINELINTCFRVTYYTYLYNTLWVEIGNSRIEVNNWDDTVWHHLIISKTEGLWIDGEKKGDFSPTNTISGEFYINGIGYDTNGINTANGYFGMIKIDDVVIIPTADGFLNTNTGELLEVVKDGTYTFTENLPIYGEGELYKTINVNVLDLNGSYDEGYTQGQADAVANAKALEVTKNGQYGDGKTLYKTINVNVIPKINVKKAGLRFGNSTFTEVPEWVDWDGVTDMYGMFQYCSNLQTIPLIDTSNVKSMSTMFSYCNHLQEIPLLNTSNVTNMYYMFYYCEKLQTIPSLDTSKVTNMTNMFYGCSSLQTIPPINTSNVTTMSQMFNNCRSLVSIPALNAQSLNMPSSYGVFGNNELPNLTDFGGFLNLKCSLTNDRNLKRLPNLTYESCINVLNGLYDFTGNGETPNSDQGHLKVHANFLTTVGDEISIGTSRGWTITA